MERSQLVSFNKRNRFQDDRQYGQPFRTERSSSYPDACDDRFSGGYTENSPYGRNNYRPQSSLDRGQSYPVGEDGCDWDYRRQDGQYRGEDSGSSGRHGWWDNREGHSGYDDWYAGSGGAYGDRYDTGSGYSDTGRDFYRNGSDFDDQSYFRSNNSNGHERYPASFPSSSGGPYRGGFGGGAAKGYHDTAYHNPDLPTPAQQYFNRGDDRRWKDTQRNFADGTPAIRSVTAAPRQYSFGAKRVNKAPLATGGRNPLLNRKGGVDGGATQASAEAEKLAAEEQARVDEEARKPRFVSGESCDDTPQLV